MTGPDPAGRPPDQPPDGDPPWWTVGGQPQPFLPSRRRRRLVLVLIAVTLALFAAYFVYVGVEAVGTAGMSM